MGPMPQGPVGPVAPLNTLAWVSVVVAFVVSPVAIVLGILARKQIARTGERGRGLATLGTVLGSVFTVIGIATTILVLALATTFTATLQATAPVPAVDTGAPAPAPSVVSAPSSAPAVPSSEDASEGQAQLTAGFIQVGSAADTMSTDIQSHRGDLDAMQRDFAAYRDAIAKFRTTATTVTLSPEVRAKVDADLIPAIDRTLADLDTLSTTQNQDKLSAAADRLQTDSQALVTAATAAIGG
jgi:peptidyl-prolyl cis-trans isomerase B (cyclophilin B)